MRALYLAILLSAGIGGVALADANVAGDWQANLGGGVGIHMNITPDGNWSSETLQKGQVVRKMQGNYSQTAPNNDAGTLVFTPTEVSKGSGKAQTETDRYRLSDNGGKLTLTADGDTMVFKKRTPR